MELATFIGLAEQAAIPRYLYLARSRQATAMSLTGPFEAADQAIEEAAAYGERIGEPDTWGVQASQLAGLAYIRHDWTRLSQLAAARGRRSCHPSSPCTCGPGCCSRPARKPRRRPWWHRYPTGRRCTGGVIPRC